jgi:hypothetical protein
MRDDPGCLGVIIAWVVFGVFLVCVGGMAALPVINGNGLSWDTSAAQHWQAQRAATEQVRQREETARTIAREREATERNAAMMLTLQVMAVAGTVGGTLIVGVTQWGRTVRHESSQRTERVRLCQDYIARYYLPGARVEVGTHHGLPAVIDHDSGEIVPYALVQREMRQLPMRQL